MKLKFLLAFLSIAFFANAQNLTGIWRGYFVSGSGILQQRYTYELQIDQLKSKTKEDPRCSIKGVTYSYQISKSFYGKAALVGMYNKTTKDITIAEDSMLDVHEMPSSFSCLMTCYLGYRKAGNTEILEGNFTSVNTENKGDCGPGYVYLERVQESDFHKEAFLLKKNPTPSSTKTNNPVAKNNAVQNIQTTPLVKRPMPSGKNFDTTAATASIPKTIAPPAFQPLTKTLPPVPAVLRERENNMVQTIVTNSPDIKIELYDNGVIDGDTITVYHNNELIVDSKELTEKPITVNITADSINAHHEFVMVANNLGKIPPNTALMVVTTGGKRYEVNISSDEKRNAKLVIDYKP
jgi:hypothetical protein